MIRLFLITCCSIRLENIMIRIPVSCEHTANYDISIGGLIAADLSRQSANGIRLDFQFTVRIILAPEFLQDNLLGLFHGRIYIQLACDFRRIMYVVGAFLSAFFILCIRC